MIVVDTSSIMAVLRSEADSSGHLAIINGNQCCVGTATLVELNLVVTRWMPVGGEELAAGLVSDLGLEIVPFGIDHYLAAREGFRRFGKGRPNPAQLNLGDCFSYGLAKAMNLPLLYKGNDFIHTDIPSAL